MVPILKQRITIKRTGQHHISFRFYLACGYRRYCFQKVLEEGKRVHMVYQGHLLRPDSAPLTEFTLDTPATFICQISHSTSSTNLNSSSADTSPNEDLDLSGPMSKSKKLYFYEDFFDLCQYFFCLSMSRLRYHFWNTSQMARIYWRPLLQGYCCQC